METFIKIAIPAVIIAAFIYNTIAWFQDRPDLTISYLVRSVTTEHPIVAFLAGLLCGHWFWQK